ncbi:MAG: RNA polymerase sigma factor [Anaerovoracaceae bacterium]
MEDYLLIRKIKDGDTAAFEQLTRKYYGHIFAYCYRRLGNQQDAEDAVQEIFLKLVKAIYKYQFTGKFRNYLYTIAGSCCSDILRRRMHERPEPVQEDDSAVSAEEETMQGEKNRILYEKLKNMNPNQREALILYYFQGLKAREVAAVMNAPLSTTKSRIRQGLQQLRKLYDEEEG